MINGILGCYAQPAPLRIGCCGRDNYTAHVQGIRTDRYRGFRWFSWLTGVPTLWFVITLGINRLLACLG